MVSDFWGGRAFSPNTQGFGSGRTISIGPATLRSTLSTDSFNSTRSLSRARRDGHRRRIVMEYAGCSQTGFPSWDLKNNCDSLVHWRFFGGRENESLNWSSLDKYKIKWGPTLERPFSDVVLSMLFPFCFEIWISFCIGSRWCNTRKEKKLYLINEGWFFFFLSFFCSVNYNELKSHFLLLGAKFLVKASNQDFLRIIF